MPPLTFSDIIIAIWHTKDFAPEPRGMDRQISLKALDVWFKGKHKRRIKELMETTEGVKAFGRDYLVSWRWFYPSRTSPKAVS